MKIHPTSCTEEIASPNTNEDNAMLLIGKKPVKIPAIFADTFASPSCIRIKAKTVTTIPKYIIKPHSAKDTFSKANCLLSYNANGRNNNDPKQLTIVEIAKALTR